MNIAQSRLNVVQNETEVLNFLHSYNIFERGQITSPGKEIWFKSNHFIQLHEADVFVNRSINRKTKRGHYYTYITVNKKFAGIELQDVTFDEVKEYVVKRY